MRSPVSLSRLKWVMVEYRRPILWAWGVFFLVYSYFIFNFIFGNHDWARILGAIPWSTHAWVGRPFYDVPHQLWQGMYIPVLMPVVSLGSYFCAGMLFLALFFGEKGNLKVFFLTFLLFLLNPVLLGRIYYSGAGIGENVALCCFFLGINFSVYDKDRKSFLLAVILFWFSLEVNQCIINTVWTVFLILYLYELSTTENLNLSRYCGAFAVALVIYLIVLKFVLPVRPYYNNQVAGIDAFLKNVLPQLKASVSYFWQTQPPMNRLFKILFSLLCLGGLACLLMRPKKAVNHGPKLIGPIHLPKDCFAVRLVLIVLLVLTHNVSAFVSGKAGVNTFSMRMDYYSIPFILCFCTFVVLQLPGLWGRAFTAVAVLLVILSMGSDVRALQVWKINMDDGILYANRMLARIEANPEFAAERTWRILTLGRPPVFVERFYPGYDQSTRELLQSHLSYNVDQVFNYIAPNLGFTAYKGTSGEVCAKNRAFLDGAPAWPAPGSLRIDREEGLILVVQDTAAARRYCAR